MHVRSSYRHRVGTTSLSNIPLVSPRGRAKLFLPWAWFLISQLSRGGGLLYLHQTYPSQTRVSNLSKDGRTKVPSNTRSRYVGTASQSALPCLPLCILAEYFCPMPAPSARSPDVSLHPKPQKYLEYLPVFVWSDGLGATGDRRPVSWLVNRYRHDFIYFFRLCCLPRWIWWLGD